MSNKITYETIKEIINKKNGKLLTTQYIDNKQKLEIECINGHIFQMSYNKISSENQWCSRCSGRKLLLEDIQKLCEQNNCICLNDCYKGAKTTVLNLVCNNGHTWTTMIDKIKNNIWCDECKKNNDNEAKLQTYINFAKKNNGECLTSEITDIIKNQIVKFRCINNHIWECIISKYMLDNDVWCKECLKYTLDDANEIAKERGGFCLSTEKTFLTHEKLKWQCINKHVWNASLHNVKDSYTWCPKCIINYNEEVVRNIFQKMFGKNFENLRPNWLINEKKNTKMELDGFNKELNIAFEYNGIQHYKYIPYFHSSEEKFKEQVDRDILKNNLCIQNNIKLIVIPYNIKINEIQNYIIKKCEELNIEIPNKNKILKNEINYVQTTSNKIYNDICKIINEHNGSLLTNDIYIKFDTKIQIECKNNHIWESDSVTLKRGSWCELCKNTKIYTMNTIMNYAINNKGSCLSNIEDSTKITNATKLEFACVKNHKWITTVKSIKLNTWCIKCHYENNMTTKLIK